MDMKQPRLEKVTLNIGSGALKERLDGAKSLLEKITGHKAVVTKAKDRNPTWKLRKGDPIGVKVTLRGKDAAAVLAKSVEAAEYTLREGSFDKCGNVAFGVREYIDFPGMKYDPKIGMMGFDVCVTLAKPGARISRRRRARRKIPAGQRVTPAEAAQFMETNFKARVAAPEAQGA
jgi:large subunit ribosomal protein L5